MQKDREQEKTNKLWQELTQVRNSLESASWQNDKIATQRLTQDEERVESLYKKEQEKLQTLYQQQKESDNIATQYLANLFGSIYELSLFFISLMNSYYPVEKEKISDPEPISANVEIISDSGKEPQFKIEPDMVFRTGMFDRLLILEKKLNEGKYLNAELCWISTHENGKPDIKRLIIFLVGLLDNRYFLPGKDLKIKTFYLRGIAR